MKKIPIRQIHTVVKEPDFSERFSIRDLEELQAGRDLVQELHRHDFFNLLVIKNGSGIHEIDFVPFTIADHSIFFMRPGQVHQLVLKAGSTGYLVQFSDGFYFPQDQIKTRLLRKAGSTCHYPFGVDKFQKLYTLFANIFEENAGQQQNYLEVVAAYLDVFLIELTRYNREKTFEKAGLYEQEKLESFLYLLEIHILSHKKVSEYAALLNLSTYQLNAVTKITLGKTSSDVINERMILEAKRNLIATPNQVNQVAYHLGYEDGSYFSRFFKKHTGYSPDAFRKKFG